MRRTRPHNKPSVGVGGGGRVAARGTALALVLLLFSFFLIACSFRVEWGVLGWACGCASVNA